VFFVEVRQATPMDHLIISFVEAGSNVTNVTLTCGSNVRLVPDLEILFMPYTPSPESLIGKHTSFGDSHTDQFSRLVLPSIRLAQYIGANAMNLIICLSWFSLSIACPHC
jgi:hypothetical protein